jgi:hypothetical protein
VSGRKGTIQISKIAAAQRQLDAAIRLFFQREDELAIHSITAAAFQLLRDLTKKRGEHFTSEVFGLGILELAKQFAAGTLPKDKRTMLEGSRLMPVIRELAEQIRLEGANFRKEQLHITISEKREHELWLSEATVFLKHADRDSAGFLSSDVLDNEKMIMATCAAYVELMKQPTPETVAYFAFWSVRYHQVEDLAEEVQRFARQLEAANESERYKMCAEYIRDNKAKALR